MTLGGLSMPNPEYLIQTKVILHIQMAYPMALLSVSPAAGFKASRGLAVKMVRMGYQKGTPDIIILEPNGVYHGLMVELKTPTGSLSPEQKRYLARAADRGYLTAVCHSAADAIKLIDAYMELPF